MCYGWHGPTSVAPNHTHDMSDNVSWRNWIVEEWPKLAIWSVALSAAYFTWLTVTSLWGDEAADYLGSIVAVVVSFLILRVWQMIQNRRTGYWDD